MPISSTPSMIQFDYSRAMLDGTGITQEEINDFLPHLESIAMDLWEKDLVDFRAGNRVTADRLPLDAAFLDLPERLLAEYDNNRAESELDRIIKSARRIRDNVDRVVVLGIGGSFMGARALMESCAHPWHNELTRAERGGWPRMYFEGNNVDNDWCQSLLQLLERDSQEVFNQGKWAIVVISKSGGTIETAAALRVSLRQMEQQFGASALPELVIPVTGMSGKLAELAESIGCQERFEVPEGVGGRFSVLSAVGLLPAALLGLDIVSLLRGAWMMNEHLRSAPRGTNVILNYVAVNQLMEKLRGIAIRVLSVWSKSLESTGLWYDQLLAESIGKQERGVTPLTVVNTRDLHSRAQQHQQGVRNKFIINLVLNSWRYDSLKIGERSGNEDQLNEFKDKTWPMLMRAAIEGTDQAYNSDGRPTATITLPSSNEHAMGQLYQMLMLATVIEARSMGINPYGQPGVELYKQNMKRILAS